MKKIIVLSILTLSVAVYGAIAIKSKEKIAFLGDSITHQGNYYEGGYVNLVMDGLARCGVKAIKIPAGRGGAKSLDYGWRPPICLRLGLSHGLDCCR